MSSKICTVPSIPSKRTTNLKWHTSSPAPLCIPDVSDVSNVEKSRMSDAFEFGNAATSADKAEAGSAASGNGPCRNGSPSAIPHSMDATAGPHCMDLQPQPPTHTTADENLN